jgi:hypothetical protein
MKERSERDLLLLKMKAEQQQHAVKLLEIVAVRDHTWQQVTDDLVSLAQTTRSQQLRTFLNSVYRTCSSAILKDNHANNVNNKVSIEDQIVPMVKLCREFVNKLSAVESNNELQASVHDLKEVLTIYDAAGRSLLHTNKNAQFVNVEITRPLSTLVSSCNQVLDKIQTVCAIGHQEMRRVSSGTPADASSIATLQQATKDLDKLLFMPQCRWIECDYSNGASVISSAKKLLDDATQVITSRNEEERVQQKALSNSNELSTTSFPPPAAHFSPLAPIVPPAATASAGSQPLGPALLGAFPYLAAQQATDAWLESVKASAANASLPPELAEQLRQCKQMLLFASLNGTQEGNDDDDDMGMTDAATDQASTAPSAAAVPANSVSMARIDLCLSDLEALLQSAVRAGPQPFLHSFIALSEVLLEEVQQVPAEADIQMYALIVSGLFRALSTKMQAQSARVFEAMMAAASDLCTPCLLRSPPGGRRTGERATKVAVLCAALVGSAHSERPPAGVGDAAIASATATGSSACSPFPASQGWAWLHRGASQMHLVAALLVQEKFRGAQAATHAQLLSVGCRTVRMFLRLSGNTLFLRYQARFAVLLSALKAAVLEAGVAGAAAASSSSTGAGAGESPAHLPAAVVAVFSADLNKLLALIDSAIGAAPGPGPGSKAATSTGGFIAPLYYRGQAPHMVATASLIRYRRLYVLFFSYSFLFLSCFAQCVKGELTNKNAWCWHSNKIKSVRLCCV